MPVRLGRVLVIDDDPDTVDLFTAILSDAGYEVVGALTGGDGLMVLEVESPDVILLDLKMPGVHGMDVLRRLRMARPDIPVIIVSGQADAELARATLRRGAAEGRLAVHVRRLDGDDVVALDTHSRRSIQSFVWAQDSRRILYGQDRDGDENTHVFVADTERPRERPRDLTPFAGQRAFVQQVIRSDAEHIVVGVNRPRTALADLHRIALTTGERTRIVDNTGDVLTWMTDDDGVVRARIRREAPGARVLERVRPDSARWEPLFTLDGEEYARAVGFTTDRAGLWLLTNQGRDRYALVRLDLATGITAVAHEHAVVDVETAGVSTLTGQPLFAIAHPDYPESRVFDATLSSDLAPLGEPGPAEVRILSFDDAERLATVRVSRDRGREHHLLDRRTGTRTLLSRSAMAPYADRLARVEPISLTRRDGLTLRGYLTRPPGARARGPEALP